MDHHSHGVDQAIKKRAVHRAKIIQGQLVGLAKAIESETYCTDLLLQSLSIQRSLKSLDALLLENHLKSHVATQIQEKDGLDRVVQELIKVYQLSTK